MFKQLTIIKHDRNQITYAPFLLYTPMGICVVTELVVEIPEDSQLKIDTAPNQDGTCVVSASASAPRIVKMEVEWV